MPDRHVHTRARFAGLLLTRKGFQAMNRTQFTLTLALFTLIACSSGSTEPLTLPHPCTPGAGGEGGVHVDPASSSSSSSGGGAGSGGMAGTGGTGGAGGSGGEGGAPPTPICMTEAEHCAELQTWCPLVILWPNTPEDLQAFGVAPRCYCACSSIGSCDDNPSGIKSCGDLLVDNPMGPDPRFLPAWPKTCLENNYVPAGMTKECVGTFIYADKPLTLAQ